MDRMNVFLYVSNYETVYIFSCIIAHVLTLVFLYSINKSNSTRTEYTKYYITGETFCQIYSGPLDLIRLLALAFVRFIYAVLILRVEYRAKE